MSRAKSLQEHYCRILLSIQQGKGSLASLLNADLKHQLGMNAGLLQEWCYGVCRWYHRLDFFASKLLERPLRRKDADIQLLIMLGLYQLLYMRTPDHAVLNETVGAAEQLHKPWAKNLINAVLREALRSQQQLLDSAAKDYSVWYSHPQWLLDQLKLDWPGHYRSIMDANNLPAPMTLRVNLRKTDRNAYLALLQQAGIEAYAGNLSATAITLSKAVDVMSLPGFRDGYVSVQDEASQLVPWLLPLPSGARVLDACAAPGGKTCALLEKAPETQLIALDNEERRLARITENLDRLGLSATVSLGDITRAPAIGNNLYDAVLLDVPCSATGVIRRHPDIKCLRTPEEVSILCGKQAALLEAAWPMLVSGGYLLYTTCSVLHSENVQQLSRFMARQPDAHAVLLDIPFAIEQSVGYQLLPEPDGHDGFYYALLQKY